MMNSSEYFEPHIETMSRSDIESLQLTRLKESVAQARKSPFYGARYAELNIDEQTITSLEDLRKLPFTTKADLRDNYPFGLNAVPQEQVVRLHSSSGTTGNPTVICHSQHDLDVWANRVARCMYMVGLRNSDVFQNTSGYGMFTGGLGIHYGVEALGALAVPAATGNSIRQIKFITDFGTTAIHAIPSYAIRLAEVFAQQGVDPRRDTKLTTLIIGAEPHTEEQRHRIEELLGVKAYNCFGMSEMSGPGVAFECKEQNGLHIWEDSYLLEIIDPDTLEPVADGEIGELVLTTLDREAMPLIRYRTRDLTRILPGECKCGRTHRRLDRIKGRSDDMFIVKGVNIFPMQIEKILMQYQEVGTNYLITIETVGNNDEIFVEVELGDAYIDDYARLQQLTKSMTRALKDEILTTPIVKLVGSGTLPQSEGKAVRVIDKRAK
ncbi:MAG: phenylacetate--CoA ligase [Rikenellaceae bacterium]